MPEPTFGAILVTDIEIDDPFTGAKATPDDTSLAEKYRNRDNALKAQPLDLRLAEASTNSATWVTIASLGIRVPDYKVGLRVKGQFKVTGTGAPIGEVRAKVGTDTSAGDSTTNSSYEDFEVTISEMSNMKGQDATFELQARQTAGTGSVVYAKIVDLYCRFVAVDE